jgi:hypothetical protein
MRKKIFLIIIFLAEVPCRAKKNEIVHEKGLFNPYIATFDKSPAFLAGRFASIWGKTEGNLSPNAAFKTL